MLRPHANGVAQLANGSDSVQYDRFDKDGHKIDAHELMFAGIHKFGSTYYIYGSDYNCGARWNDAAAQSASPNPVWCGFRVYESTDLVHWKNSGLALQNQAGYEPLCRYGLCQNPSVYYDPDVNGGLYLLWGLDIQGSATPAGPFQYLAPLPAGGGGPWIDPDNGTKYVIKNNYDGCGGAAPDQQFNMRISEMTWSQGTQCILGNGGNNCGYSLAGTPIYFGTFFNANSAMIPDPSGPRGTLPCGATVFGEGHPILKHTASGDGLRRFYLFYSYPGCSFCSNGNTRYIASRGGPSGKLTDQTTGSTGWLENLGGLGSGTQREWQYSAGSCAGQISGIDMPLAGTFLWTSDRWLQSDNNYPANATYMYRHQARANLHWETGSFNSNGHFQGLTCGARITVPQSMILTRDKQTAISNLDQTSGVDRFVEFCDVGRDIGGGGRVERAQTFTVGKTGTMTSVNITTFQSGVVGTDGSYGNVFPNAGLTIRVVTLSGGSPTNTDAVTPCAIARRAPASDGYVTPLTPDKVGMSARKYSCSMSLAVTKGDQYAIRVSSTNTVSQGCYGVLYNDTGIAYSSGRAYYSNNSGSSWSLESGRALKFETIVQ